MKAEADRFVHSPSLSDQVRDCGAIGKENPETGQVNSAVSVAALLVNNAQEDRILLKPSVLKLRKFSAEFAELCQHHDLFQFVDQLKSAELPAEAALELHQ